MTRLHWHGTIALCLVSAVAVAAGQEPVFRSLGDAVRVFVTVTDGDGRLITDLTRENFEIRDEGKPQPITLFDNSPQPIRLIVMLDVSGSMEGNLQLLRASAQELFVRLRPDDLVRVGTFGNKIEISPTFTRDPIELREALPIEIARDAPTPLWRAVDDAMEAFGEEDPEVRRVVLVLSDGHDSGPIGFRERFVSQAEIIDRARDEDVMVYAIGMHSRSARRRMPGIGPDALRMALTQDLPDPGLGKVAVESGGGYMEIRFGDDLGAAFAQVADELHAQYMIGFAPAKLDGKVHEIEVKLDRRGLKARARREYVAPKAG